MSKLLLTIPDVAERLSLSRAKVYQLLSGGDLKAVHIGRATRVPMAEIERYLSVLAGGAA